MSLKGSSALAVALLALVLACAGCGSSSSSSSAAGGGGGTSGTTSSTSTKTVHFATAKFVLHAGLAFGAFHRYLYKPFKAGVFGKPSSHKAALIKAALATAFIIHELKIAYTDAQSSSALAHLVAPLTALKDKITGTVDGLKAGNPAQLHSAQGDLSSIASQAAGAGASIKDVPVPNL